MEGKHPKQESPDMEVEKSAVLELLRNEGLSIEHLDQETKGRVRAVMEYLHWEREISMTDIAELIGNKTSGYVSWLFKKIEVKARDFEEGRLKGIHDKVRIHERKPFEGTDEDKAYMLGLKHGDLYAYRPFGDAVRVSTSTTHPALAELFTQLFSPHGHMSKHPRYKKDTGTYGWNFEVILDKSFGFLLESRDTCREWVITKDSTMLAYLSGLIDAEGNIRPHANPRTVAITVTTYNTDIDLLGFAYECLRRLGSRPLRPYLDKEAGYVSTKGFRIPMRKDYWRVMVARFDEAQTLLRRLPLCHKEKVALKEVALSVAKGEPYERIADRVASLKKTFDEEVDRYTKEAESEYRRTHPGINPPLELGVKESANGDDAMSDVAEQGQAGRDGVEEVDSGGAAA